MNKLIIKEFEKSVISLCNEIENKIKTIEDDRIKDLKISFFEELRFNKEKAKIDIAFVGQYNAGKSTILKALTGIEDIQIGQNIVTTEAKAYAWDNCIVYDTPGICTERKDHDLISIDYMNKADLIVYVTTFSGFDNLIGNNFRKIAFDENRKEKIMLVVNKKSIEKEENQENMINDIKKVIYPLSIDEVKLTVIDANEYLDSMKKENKEFSNQLIEMSAFDKFISNLNDFVNEKGFLGRYISLLNISENYISKIIDVMTSDDNDLMKTQELLRQEKFILESSVDKLKINYKVRVDKLFNEINKCGYEIATMIGSDIEHKEIMNENKKKLDYIQEYCELANDELLNIIKNEIEELNNSLKMLTDGDLFKELNLTTQRIDFNVKLTDIRLGDRLKQLPDILTNIGNVFKNAATNATVKGGNSLKNVAGSDMHNIVLKVGDFLGKDFKPWEAVKIADKIGKIGKLAGAAGIVLGPAIAIWEEIAENKYKKSLSKARSDVKNNYYEIAKGIKDNYNINLMENIIPAIYKLRMNEIKDSMKELRSKELSKNKIIETLFGLEKEVTKLLSHMVVK